MEKRKQWRQPIIVTPGALRVDSPLFVAVAESLNLDPIDLAESLSSDAGECGCNWPGHGVYQL